MNERNKTSIRFMPPVIRDCVHNCAYVRGKFLGRGGFANCYQVTQIGTDYKYAIKVVDRNLLKNKKQMDKMIQEVGIHGQLNHKNIVQMYHSFKDLSNFYLVLELCRNNTLLELQERRKTVTIPEAKYFCKNIAEGIDYLHDRHIIHRDLKLNNIFLNKDMEVKIGDFGLTARLNDPRELRMSVCGTPNYIAPEILNRIGHSFEVDIWAFGCILYALLVGKPPFEAQTKNDIFEKINTNSYFFPEEFNIQARKLIKEMLSHNPLKRPKIKEILNCSFLTEGYIPEYLPLSCLVMRPRFPKEVIDKNCNKNNYERHHIVQPIEKENIDQRRRITKYLDEASFLLNQLRRLYSTKHKLISSFYMDEALHPRSSPVYYCTKWMDLSYKYGFGYELCDGSIGILFNDKTHLVSDGDMKKLQYIDIYDNEEHYMISDCPERLAKKMKILKIYKTYMENKLSKTIIDTYRDDNGISRLPIIIKWEKNDTAIAMFFSNGTLQVNFLKDHFKVIVCPHMKAISLIDGTQELKTYKLKILESCGWDEVVDEKLKYLIKILEKWTAFKRKRKSNDDNDLILGVDDSYCVSTTKKKKIFEYP
ncbi:Serine/threonine-protein kinase polo [Strongyloides ratti]|uniref:Serine/threonine-protein kinase PLK n=1 Tax=Strongyloides ratti TaxID=34506 RepID=A0A090LCW8_STRRB|nr:Serine/threonine-protein kinase polo [Strongyloides ratti]CEF65973.1 Serine/threonine-protein kinase polo [Strongyloides ratti]